MPGKRGDRGRSGVDNRLFVDACLQARGLIDGPEGVGRFIADAEQLNT